MKELDILLKTVVDGLKSMAKAVETLAEKVESLSTTLPQAATESKPKSRRKAPAAAAKKTPKKTRKKTASKTDNKPATAAETVLGVIRRSRKGVDTATLMAKTGYDRKKVANIIYKLKRQGNIKTADKGVYIKS